MLKIKRLLFTCIMTVLPVITAQSALVLQINKYDPVLNISIDISQYPKFKARLKASQNGLPVTINKSNLIVVEDCWAQKPLDVALPDSGGWQEVVWNTRIKGPYTSARFIFSNNFESGFIDGYDTLRSMSQIRMTNSQDHEEPDMYFGDIPPGTDTTRGIIVCAPMGLIINGREQKIRVDSVKTHNPAFSYFWKGEVDDSTKPPVNLTSPFYYRVRLNFKPTDTKYYRDKFSVYYAGGKIEEINLIGNNYLIKRNTVLNVTKPNGGEVFYPCQNDTIRWRGFVKGIPTNIYYSVDGGVSWKGINSTLDSFYVWRIPDENSTNVLVKVKQNFKNTSERLLKVDDIPIHSIAYRNDGYSVLSANEAGVIHQWDITSFTLSNDYRITPLVYPYQKLISTGTEFISNDSIIVNSFYMITPGDKERYDSLAYFTAGNPDPINKVAVQPGFLVKKMAIDRTKQKLALVPEFGNTLLILSAKDGNLIQKVDFPYPITSFSFSTAKDEAVVSLYDGEVKFLNTNDFSVFRTLDFSDIPILKEISISANSELLGLGCQTPTPNILVGNNNQMHVAEAKTGMIVRSVRNISSNPVGLEFSPTSNVLVIGAAAQPQISLWDLPSNDFIGSMAGSDYELTGFKFSPEGHSILASASKGNTLTVRFFTYPEEDSSDAPFSILSPVLSIQKLSIEPKYLGTSNAITTTAQFCNTGQVPFIIANAKMLNNVHFHLLSNFDGDTLFPNQCLTVSINYNPLDTGKLTDSIMINSCNSVYFLPLESYSIKRNIALLQNSFDFGDLCLNNISVKTFELARNDDPVELKINTVTFDSLGNNPFSIQHNVRDTIIPPGGKLVITAAFSPKQLGMVLRNFRILHSDQYKMFEQTPVKGTGIGSFLQVSHQDLRFIPEISDRKLNIKNLTNNIVTISQFDFNPTGIFTVTDPLPITVLPQMDYNLNVHWNGTETTDVRLDFQAEPCLAQTGITLGMYSGTSSVTLPAIGADPKGEATIPVSFTNNSPYQYKGTRFFDCEFTVNPRMFLPEEVTSAIGIATMTKNEIYNDKRIIGFRVEGDFPDNGIVANIKGIVGLAETDFSQLAFNDVSAFWGKSVKTTYNIGSLKLINLCNDRRILQPGNIKLLSVYPNPGSDHFNIQFNLQYGGTFIAEIWDEIGNKLMTINSDFADAGEKTININASNLPAGNYKIILRSGTASDTGALFIYR